MEHQIQQFETHVDDLPKQILADTVHGEPEGLEGYLGTTERACSGTPAVRAGRLHVRQMSYRAFARMLERLVLFRSLLLTQACVRYPFHRFCA